MDTNIYGRKSARKTLAQMMAGVDHTGKPTRIANNTVRYTRANGDVVVRLHLTDIITRHKNGTITLNSGGFRTLLVKDRIRRFSPAVIYSDRHAIWHVHSQTDHAAPPVPFFDGMKVDAEGRAIGVTPAKAERVVKREKTARARIKKFCGRLDQMEHIPQPDTGDCWLCAFHDQNGKPVGDQEHLKSHVQEGYLHGSLIYNAMKATGLTATGIGLTYMSANRGDAYARDRVKRALRKYLSQAYGLPSR